MVTEKISITAPFNNNILHPDTAVKNKDMQNTGNNTSEASKNTVKAPEAISEEKILSKQKRLIRAKE